MNKLFGKLFGKSKTKNIILENNNQVIFQRKKPSSIDSFTCQLYDIKEEFSNHSQTRRSSIECYKGSESGREILPLNSGSREILPAFNNKDKELYIKIYSRSSSGTFDKNKKIHVRKYSIDCYKSLEKNYNDNYFIENNIINTTELHDLFCD
jgi:hypothetical protein